MNEACLNAKWLGKDLTQVEAQEFTKDVLNHMRERLSDYQEQYGDLYNLEATPAESTTYRFAKHDKETFPNIITANENGTPYYTNSSHLPVGYTEDIFSALDVQDELQTLYTSGTVFHAFLGEKLPDWKAAATLVRKIAENYKLPYYTISPTYSVCKNHGYIAGEVYECPCCHEKTEVYSRITGYYRPVQNWNDGKAQEFEDRKVYEIDASRFAKSSAAFASVVEQTSRAASAAPLDRGATTVTSSGESTDASIAEMPTKVSASAPSAPKVEIPLMEASLKSGLYLVATHTCPNCHYAAAQMDKAGIVYQVLYAEENQDLIARYNLMQAPSMLKVESDGSIEVLAGAPAVFKEVSLLIDATR